MQFHAYLFTAPCLAILKATSSYAGLLGTQIVPVTSAFPSPAGEPGEGLEVFNLNEQFLSTDQIISLVKFLTYPENPSPRSVAEGVKVVMDGFDIPCHHFQEVSISNGQLVEWRKKWPTGAVGHASHNNFEKSDRNF